MTDIAVPQPKKATKDKDAPKVPSPKLDVSTITPALGQKSGNDNKA